MSSADPHPPQAIMPNSSSGGWLNPGNGISNDSYVRTQARNTAICRDNDAGTRLHVIARTHGLHNTTVTRILAENGRRPNIDPTPAGARDVVRIPGEVKRPHQTARPVSTYDPSIARIKMDSENLLKAILRSYVRQDRNVPGMTFEQMRQRCQQTGVAFPA